MYAKQHKLGVNQKSLEVWDTPKTAQYNMMEFQDRLAAALALCPRAPSCAARTLAHVRGGEGGGRPTSAILGRRGGPWRFAMDSSATHPAPPAASDGLVCLCCRKPLDPIRSATCSKKCAKAIRRKIAATERERRSLHLNEPVQPST